jgi:hypothetical protein
MNDRLGMKHNGLRLSGSSPNFGGESLRFYNQLFMHQESENNQNHYYH